MVDDTNVQRMTDQLLGNFRLRVLLTVQNNPTAIRENIDSVATANLNIHRLTDLIMAMDEEEQEAVLNVPYLRGNDATMDEVYDRLMEQLREAEMGGALEAASTKFILAAAAGLFAAGNAVAGMISAREAEAIQARNEAAEATAAITAESAARGRKIRRMNGLKKAAPWLIAVAVLIALIIYKLKS